MSDRLPFDRFRWALRILSATVFDTTAKTAIKPTLHDVTKRAFFKACCGRHLGEFEPAVSSDSQRTRPHDLCEARRLIARNESCKAL